MHHLPFTRKQMTLSELDDTLPNGLHDAYLTGMSIRFDQSTATLFVKVLVSETEERVRHADAEIRLQGLLAIVVEGPESVSRAIAGRLGMSSFTTTAEHFRGLISFPPETHGLFHSLYIEEPWNSFIHIAATSAEIEWRSNLK